MLFLKSGLVSIENNAFLVSDSMHSLLVSQEWAAVCGEASLECYRLFGNTEQKPVRFQWKKKIYVKQAILQALFAHQDYLLLGDDFPDKLASYNKACSKPPVSFHIKPKDGSYTRFLLIDPAGNLFLESYSDWSGWQALVKEIDEVKKGIDFSIKHHIDDIPDKMRLLTSSAAGFLRGLGMLPEALSGQDEMRVLHIYWPGACFFMPVENVFPNMIVEHFIPGVFSSERLSGDSAVLIYSDKLFHTAGEVQDIYQILKEKRNVELFPEHQFHDYTTGVMRANYFHYSGHGESRENKGAIFLRGKMMGELPSYVRPEIAFLNCCQAGFNPDGIVSSFIKNGTGSVIASPYEIPDSGGFYSEAVKDFYRFLSGAGAAQAYNLTALVHKDFQRYYRLYAAYHDKI